MKDIIMCDVDGTLSDDAKRAEEFVHPSMSPEDWDKYHSESFHDLPFQSMVDAVNAWAASGLNVFGLTARPRKWYGITHRWMTMCNVRLHCVLMRPDGNYMKSPEVKMLLARPYLPRILLVIDDRDDVLQAFRSQGITTLQHVAARNGQ
jgi:hypothetical protein